MDFGEVMGKSIDMVPSGEALIIAVKEAAKILLNTIRVAGAQILVEKLTQVLI